VADGHTIPVFSSRNRGKPQKKSHSVQFVSWPICEMDTPEYKLQALSLKHRSWFCANKARGTICMLHIKFVRHLMYVRGLRSNPTPTTKTSGYDVVDCVSCYYNIRNMWRAVA